MILEDTCHGIEVNMFADLPPLSIDSMTQLQLTEVIPKLVKLSTGREYPHFGESEYRPDWWPNSTPWARPEMKDEENTAQMQVMLLREIVRSCYSHLGKEQLLGCKRISEIEAVENAEKENVSLQSNTLMAQEPKVSTQIDSSKEESDPIWICFLCAKQFQNQDILMVHQEECEREQEIIEVQEKLARLAKEKEKLDQLNREKMRLEQFSKEKDQLAELKVQREIITRQRKVKYREKLNLHRERISRQRDVIRHEEKEIMKFNSTTLKNPPFMNRKRRRLKPDLNIPPPKPDFIKCLGLKEKPKETSETSFAKKEVDSDCEIVDVTLPDGVSAPLTPRTPKSLMSQLSKETDNTVRRRHLSFSSILSDSECDSEDDDSGNKVSSTLSVLLFRIDVTSVLGQRIKKNLKIMTDIPITKNYEQYCKGPEKNEFINKLRQSDRSYPIVYKSRRKFLTFTHEYKFNASQRREFMIQKQTGLTRRSRNLLRYLKKCKVVLTRLKPSIIQEWTRPKPKPIVNRPMHSMWPMNETHLRQILSKPLYGPKSARLRQINDNISRVHAAHAASPASRQYDIATKIVTNSDGTETMKLIYVPKPFRGPRPLPAVKKPPVTDANRRKQSFHPTQIRQMDDIQIIELSDSSDEEEDAKKLNLPCKNCSVRQKCPLHTSAGNSSSFHQVRPTSLHMNKAVRQTAFRGTSLRHRPPYPSRSAVFTGTQFKQPSPSTLPNRFSSPRQPRPLLRTFLNNGISVTNFSDLNRSLQNPQSIQIKPLSCSSTPSPSGIKPQQQQHPPLQDGMMRTVIGPDGQMRVERAVLPKPRQIIRKIPLKPVESNRPDEAIVLDDDDDD